MVITAALDVGWIHRPEKVTNEVRKAQHSRRDEIQSTRYSKLLYNETGTNREKPYIHLVARGVPRGLAQDRILGQVSHERSIGGCTSCTRIRSDRLSRRVFSVLSGGGVCLLISCWFERSRRPESSLSPGIFPQPLSDTSDEKSAYERVRP